ncbi:MAG: aldehyde dehydrogenase [Gammaproteobacteria bacterium]
MTKEICTGWRDGAWVQPDPDALRLDLINPVTESSLGQLVSDSAASVDRAVASARASFEAGTWSRRSVADCKAVLLRIRDLILARGDELAAIESLNVGIPLSQARQRHVPRAALNFEFFAEFISQVPDAVYHQDPKFMSVVRHDPAGVAALIAPWNAPLALATMKLAGALAFGNSCVLKPSELTPLPFIPLMEILKAAGLPDGVVNMVNGGGSETGAALVAHPGIDVVAFTGGTGTGREIGAAAGRGLKRLVTELGGKSANIVFADADLDRALHGAVIAGYSANGQQCLAGTRLLVQRSIANEFIHRFVARVRALRVGPPSAADTDIGPLISRGQLERVVRYAAIGRQEGAEILTGGRRHPDFERGYYVEPTVALATSNDAVLCQEEIFGPFVTILVFDELEEALQLANGTGFGLVAYVWTSQLATAMAAADGLRSGVVWINTTLHRELRAPFGGCKSSGVGRAGGEWSRTAFTEEKTISIPLRAMPLPAFGPP